MNISPVSFNNFKANYKSPSQLNETLDEVASLVMKQIKRDYPNYRPNMKDSDVVTWCSCGPNYRYPFTAGQVRQEFVKRTNELLQKYAEEKEDEKSFEDYMENNSCKQNITSWGPNYTFHVDTDSY